MASADPSLVSNFSAGVNQGIAAGVNHGPITAHYYQQPPSATPDDDDFLLTLYSPILEHRSHAIRKSFESTCEWILDPGYARAQPFLSQQERQDLVEQMIWARCGVEAPPRPRVNRNAEHLPPAITEDLMSWALKDGTPLSAIFTIPQLSAFL